MRNNQPVTQQEHDYPAHEMLVSSTDTKGHITHCNHAFVEVSGYTYDELIGQPHNLIRHPDMPAEAFRDLWRTIGNGHPWTGLVKNRRKNGDHYWVQANVTPIMDNGKPTGYLSVRTKPTRQQVQAAEALYARINQGESGLGLHRGHIQRSGWAGAWDRWQHSSADLRLGLLLTVVLLVGHVPSLIGHGPWAGALEWALQLLGAVAVMFWFRASVSGPLRHADQRARDVAACNLTQGIQVAGPEPLASLMRSLSQIQVNLRAVISDVRTEVDGFSRSAHDIANASQDLSERTETQASSLEETAASMEEITATVQQTSANAQAMAHQTQRSTQVAASGQRAIRDVENAMTGIERSSSRMSEIIATIEGIAFQTNILALNAAVEAARAGDQGRGFAVVASEVRGLAQRSASAAKEIRELIQTSVHQVSDGVRQMQGASHTIDDVVHEVQAVSTLVEEIQHAAQEQSEGLSQINSAVDQLDHVTQQNAAMVEQTNDAAHALSTGSESLRRSVAVFKL
ncbi:methyl-accepting chemotaxis protein [Hydrogenophaga soli]|nr:methyl-accepting chemotaxis protein [Burkholderiaceae bacterium]